MNPREKHPTVDQWIAWLAGTLPQSTHRSMEQHLDNCERCKGDMSVLRELDRAAANRDWQDPPASALDQSLALPEDPGIPPLPEKSEDLELLPADVRGHAALAGDGAQLLARNHPEARLSLMIRPPEGNGHWHISGRVWLRKASDEAIKAVLVDHEHVISTVSFGSGVPFTIKDVASRGWELELHLPQGSCLRVKNPVQ